MPLIAADTEIRYTATGGAAYVLPCEIEVATDFMATIDGVVVTAYTLSGVGLDTGVTCTFDAAPTPGAEIVLARVAPYDRQRYDYQLGDFNPDTIDADVDRVVALIQQLATTLKRVPKAKRGRLDLALELEPSPGNLVGWSGDGLSLVNLEPLTISPSTLVFTATGQALATAANAAGARSAIGAMSQSDVNTSIAATRGWRNLLVNGDFQVDRRNEGTAVNLGVASGTLCADRWFVRSLAAPSGTLTAQRVATSTLGAPQFALRLARSAGTYANGLCAEQILPWDDTHDLFGKTVTISCLIRKGAAFSGSGVRLSVITGGAVSGHASLVAGTWLDILTPGTVTIAAASIGTSFAKVSLPVVITGGLQRIAALRVEALGFSGAGAASDYVEIADAQFEVGAFATDFERVPLPLQMARCERFFETSYPPGQRPGTVSTSGQQIHRAQGTGSLLDTIRWRYRVPKTQFPTVTWYSPATGAAGFVRDTTAPADVAVTGSQAGGLDSTGCPTIAAGVAGRLYEAHFAVDDEYRA